METKKNDWDRERSHNPDMDEQLHVPPTTHPPGDKSRDGTEEVAETKPAPPPAPDEDWKDRGK